MVFSKTSPRNTHIETRRMRAAAIEVKGLTKTFGRTNRALDDVSLSIEQGEMVALIGIRFWKIHPDPSHRGVDRGDRRRGVALSTCWGNVSKTKDISSAARCPNAYRRYFPAIQPRGEDERLSNAGWRSGRVPRWRAIWACSPKKKAPRNGRASVLVLPRPFASGHRRCR